MSSGLGDVRSRIVARFTAAGVLAALALAGSAVRGQQELATCFGIGGHFGFGLAAPGDVNGDGVPDVLVGAPLQDTTRGTDCGAAWVCSGSTLELLRVYEGTEPYARFGWAVAGAGDIDGDGAPELLIGAPHETSGFGSPPGRVELRSGRSGLLLHTWSGTARDDRFGSSVAGGHDVDADGVPDVVIGAYGDGTGGFAAGAVRVYSGRSRQLLHEFFGVDSDNLGGQVASPGDLDGDGHADVAASAIGYGADNRGRVVVWSGADGHVLMSALGKAPSAFFGRALAVAGDVDADGVTDLIAGSSGPSVGKYAAVLSGDDGATLLTLNAFPGSGQVGARVGGAGDVDHDGHADVAVSGYAAPFGTRIFSGSDGAALYSVGDAEDIEPVALLGDVNGDGEPDLAVADPEFAYEQGPEVGRVRVVSSGTAVPTWTVVGHGLPGLDGVIPELVGTGTLQAGTPVALTVTKLYSATSGVLVIGASLGMLPLKGGVLVPAPQVVLPGIPVADQTVQLSATWPAGLPPGTPLWLQLWFADALGPQGFIATNGLQALTP